LELFLTDEQFNRPYYIGTVGLQKAIRDRKYFSARVFIQAGRQELKIHDYSHRQAVQKNKAIQARHGRTYDLAQRQA
jgi:hypothetical protein